METHLEKIGEVRTKFQGSLKGFIDFIRSQGVVGLAIGFILGGAVSKIVSSLVTDVITPLITAFAGLFGNVNDLKTAVWQVGSASILWGSFVSNLIDFVIIALVVYYGFRLLGIEKLDAKK